MARSTSTLALTVGVALGVLLGAGAVLAEARVVPSVSGPGCTSSVVSPPVIPSVTPSYLRVSSGVPDGIATSSTGAWSFVTVNSGSASGVWVLSDKGRVPRRVRIVRLPEEPYFDALTPNGRYLLVSTVKGSAEVIDVRTAERGGKRSVLGTLTIPGAGIVTGVAASADGRYAFVANEHAGEVAVFDLARALATGFRKSALVGVIPIDGAVVQLALSTNGRWLYATGEQAPASPGLQAGQGVLSVINVRQAESHPRRSVVTTVSAGCSPTRIAVSPNGQVVWVTARSSNALLGFSTAGLLGHDPGHALEADVTVGQNPEPVVLLNHGQDILVGDSSRLVGSGAESSLTLVSASAALAGQPALLGTIASGLFPRWAAVDPDGDTAVIADSVSQQLEVVTIPAGIRAYATAQS
jgi:DNA-binding beta-propeller fold protein YncE